MNWWQRFKCFMLGGHEWRVKTDYIAGLDVWIECVHCGAQKEW